MTMQSETIGKLAEALAKAQAVIENAAKDAENPGFKRDNKAMRYATLASVWDACRAQLTGNGLSVVQTPVMLTNGECVLRTVMLHGSGEWIASETPIKVPQNATAQQFGSAMTYARRYALSAIAGVAPDDDDDGNAAADAKAPVRAKEAPKAPEASPPPEPPKEHTQPSKKRLAGFFERPSYTIAWPESTDKKLLTIEEQCASWLGHWTAVIDKLDTADEWMKLSVDNADMLQMLKRGVASLPVQEVEYGKPPKPTMYEAAVKAHKEAGKKFDPNRIPLVGG